MILVDLDEVFSDFIGSALKLHGWERSAFEVVRSNSGGGWDVTATLGISNTQFWKPINELGELFWYQLEPLPWLDELCELLNQCGEWFIISSPSWHLGSYTGKLKWIHEHLGDKMLHRTFLTHHKQLLAAPGRYLIDDRPANVWKFEDEGGKGIVFPSLGNPLKEFADNPVEYIRQTLTKLGVWK